MSETRRGGRRAEQACVLCQKARAALATGWACGAPPVLTPDLICAATQHARVRVMRHTAPVGGPALEQVGARLAGGCLTERKNRCPLSSSVRVAVTANTTACCSFLALSVAGASPQLLWAQRQQFAGSGIGCRTELGDPVSAQAGGRAAAARCFGGKTDKGKRTASPGAEPLATLGSHLPTRSVSVGEVTDLGRLAPDLHCEQPWRSCLPSSSPGWRG